ncbi:hypothetical protein, partial [Dysosmobacter sp.]|uniref:hypothetical protein n=1 Tax=Dysosmobacter sp. TaxID=2591382 RepID=UPI003A923A8F
MTKMSFQVRFIKTSSLMLAAGRDSCDKSYYIPFWQKEQTLSASSFFGGTKKCGGSGNFFFWPPSEIWKMGSGFPSEKTDTGEITMKKR